MPEWLIVGLLLVVHVGLLVLVAMLLRMETQLTALVRESMPSDGATMSFRINELGKAATDARVAVADAKSAAEEARNAARSAQESTIRLERAVNFVQNSVDALQTAQALATSATKQFIQTITQSQDRIETNVGKDMVGRDKTVGGA